MKGTRRTLWPLKKDCRAGQAAIACISEFEGEIMEGNENVAGSNVKSKVVEKLPDDVLYEQDGL